jgi:lysophospholipase L1-like esterase
VLPALALAMVLAGGGAGGDRKPVSMLALGDSYTIGEAVAADARWPVQLASGLRAGGIAITNPDIVARTGWTTDELMAALDAVERGESVALTAADEMAPRPARPYALVTLLIGVNNQYRGRAVEDYVPQFRDLLDRAIGHAGGEPKRVIVLSIPDWGVTPFAAANGRDAATVGAAIDAYNAAARAICAERGVAFVDITPLTREAAERRELLAEDGLHPSGLDYARWAEAALPAARAALGR